MRAKHVALKTKFPLSRRTGTRSSRWRGNVYRTIAGTSKRRGTIPVIAGSHKRAATFPIRISCAPSRLTSMTSANAVRRLRSSIPVQHRNAKAPSFAVASAVVIGALAATALLNRHLAKKAERDNPAAGRFLDVNGVRLHYVERGSGEPLVLLHGNGHYPTARPDVVAMGSPALPLVGDILSHTLSPLISRAIWPLMMGKNFRDRAGWYKLGIVRPARSGDGLRLNTKCCRRRSVEDVGDRGFHDRPVLGRQH
jgi:hypothetical protein